MTRADAQEAALRRFRDELNVRAADVVNSLGGIKRYDMVDDDQVDEAVESVRRLAEAFNEAAPLLGLGPVDVPDPLDPSPYQDDEDEEDD
jgi:hypothetical protein